MMHSIFLKNPELQNTKKMEGKKDMASRNLVVRFSFPSHFPQEKPAVAPPPPPLGGGGAVRFQNSWWEVLPCDPPSGWLWSTDRDDDGTIDDDIHQAAAAAHFVNLRRVPNFRQQQERQRRRASQKNQPLDHEGATCAEMLDSAWMDDGECDLSVSYCSSSSSGLTDTAVAEVVISRTSDGMTPTAWQMERASGGLVRFTAQMPPSGARLCSTVYALPDVFLSRRASAAGSASSSELQKVVLCLKEDLPGSSSMVHRHSSNNAVEDEDRQWLSIHLVCPPIISIEDLLLLPMGGGGEVEKAEETKARQLLVMQRILDAAQDVGYFLMSGCPELQRHADALLTAIQTSATKRLLQCHADEDDDLGQSSPSNRSSGSPQLDYHHVNTTDVSSSFHDRVSKWTLWSSTGMVKTNFNPPQFAAVVLPSWLSSPTPTTISAATNIPSGKGAELESLCAAYTAAAKPVIHVLMETLMQAEVHSEDWYLLLRSVIYPPPARGSGGRGSHEETILGVRRRSSHAVLQPQQSQPLPIADPTSSSHRDPHSGGAVSSSSNAAAPPLLDPHTDKSWITLLATTSFDGLQYSSTDGTGFVDAVDSDSLHQYSMTAMRAPTTTRRRASDQEGDGLMEKGSGGCGLAPFLMVNIGDAFQMQSQGAFLSRTHLAQHAGGSRWCRASVALFVEPGEGHWPKPYCAEESRLMMLSL